MFGASQFGSVTFGGADAPERPNVPPMNFRTGEGVPASTQSLAVTEAKTGLAETDVVSSIPTTE